MGNFKMRFTPTAKKIKKSGRLTLAALIFCLALPASAPALTTSTFLYKLSNFTGPIPYDLVRISVDRERNEVYVPYQNVIRVFNEQGMEIYQFGDDLTLGQLLDVAIDADGNILLLSYTLDKGEAKAAIFRCNYRGELLGRVELKNLPPDVVAFRPNRMLYRNGHLYFASEGEMGVVVTDRDGNFKRHHNLFSLLELAEKDKGNVELTGFNVDDRENVLFTVAVQFKAYVLSPDGTLRSFGRPGGAPGHFNVVAGIAADRKGNYLIADKLKSAVMVFDSNFNFLTQFGYRGSQPGNLTVPADIAVDKKDRIYVTQARKQGVSVFKLTD